MPRHRFDAFSTALGVIAVALGVLVAAAEIDSLGTGLWLALGVLVAGLALIPWTRQRAPHRESRS